MQVGMPAIT